MATTLRPGCNPEDIGYMLLITTYVFFAPTIVTTALRLWVRRRDKALGGDDATITVACLLSIALGAINIVGVASGKGHHACALGKSAIVEVGKLSWINQVILFITLCLIKTSICLLLLRIKTTKHFSWFIYAIIALMSLTTLEAIIALMVECTPVYAFWNRSAGKCRSPNLRIYSIYVQASFSVFTDLLCSLLPIVILWKLQLPTRKKVGICVLMGLGLV
nr:hypothetical protein B0A51_02607 [Rachicladosporium sp. CCFEE 5018]